MQLSADHPRELALAALRSVEISETGLLEYRSSGRVTVIGKSESLQAAAELRPPLSLQALLSSDGGDAGEVIDVSNRQVRIKGYLGNFRILVDGGDEAEVVESDLVLDLGVEPLLSVPLPPPGYVALGLNPGATLSQLIENLEGLYGTFEKPEFFRYDPDRCAHARNGVTACTRCIDACPAGAIHGLVEQVAVDPYLCQGGGVCASVCPSGAIDYAYPLPGDLGKGVRAMLRSYIGASGSDPLVLFHGRESTLPDQLEALPNLLPVAVEEVASVGVDTWLSALAWGASGVLLPPEPGVPEAVEEALKEQLQLAVELLRGLDYPPNAVDLWHAGCQLSGQGTAMLPITPATHAAMNDKRSSLYLAIDHLTGQARQNRKLVTLSNGAPFGEAVVNDEACTLCMACAGVCPSHALQDGQGEPKLRFIEANCIQCGLCTRTCPEDAIWISPRFVFDRDERNSIRVLHEEELFHCITCSKPFATRSVVENILGKLSGNWMFQSERARRRLTMCDECRVVDVVQDSQAMSLNQPQRAEH